MLAGDVTVEGLCQPTKRWPCLPGGTRQLGGQLDRQPWHLAWSVARDGPVPWSSLVLSIHIGARHAPFKDQPIKWATEPGSLPSPPSRPLFGADVLCQVRTHRHAPAGQLGGRVEGLPFVVGGAAACKRLARIRLSPGPPNPFV